MKNLRVYIRNMIIYGWMFKTTEYRAQYRQPDVGLVVCRLHPVPLWEEGEEGETRLEAEVIVTYQYPNLQYMIQYLQQDQFLADHCIYIV